MKKNFLFLLAFLLFVNVLFTQTKIDSALNMMNVDSIHDSTKIQKLFEAASSLSFENPILPLNY